jgi:glutaredoxin
MRSSDARRWTPNLDDALTAPDIRSRELTLVNTSNEAQGGAKTGVTLAPTVTLLVTTGCPYCEDARGELAARADLGDLELTVVPVDSAQGRALQATHRPSMFPLVLVDGKPFSIGRLPRRKLDRALARSEAH